MLLRNFSYRGIYLTLLLLMTALVLLSARVGAVSLSTQEIMAIIGHHAGFATGHTNPVHEGIFFEIRLPRTILCIFCGASLSVSGALMQSLFRNPIVEPGLVGTSAGSAFGAALMVVLGSNIVFSSLSFLGNLLMPVCAFAGGLLATLLVYYFAASLNRISVSVMILAGIAINAIANGGTGFLAYMARDPQARTITFWSLGSLSGATWAMVSIIGTTTIAGILLSLQLAKPLNALQLGDREAGYLGIRTERVKIYIILVNTLLVAVTTAMVGIIGFVGLIVPHLLRMLKGSDNRYLIIGSALMGAIVLLLTDMICRVIIAPAEMPIGIVTAFVGAPVFLWLLSRIKNSRQQGGFYA